MVNFMANREVTTSNHHAARNMKIELSWCSLEWTSMFFSCTLWVPEIGQFTGSFLKWDNLWGLKLRIFALYFPQMGIIAAFLRSKNGVSDIVERLVITWQLLPCYA